MSDREQSGAGETPEEVPPAVVEPVPKVEPVPNVEPGAEAEPVPGTVASAESGPEVGADTSPPPEDALPPVPPAEPPADTPPPPPPPPAAAAPPRPVEEPAETEEDHDRPRRTVGIILIALGAWFFLDQFFDFWNWGELWPVLLILLGLLLLFRR